MCTDVAEWLAVARTGLLSDAMDLCGLPANAAGDFRLFGRTRCAIGRAATIQQAAIGPEGGTGRHGEIALATAKGSILVVAMPASCQAVTWGEGHTLRALIAGLAGVVLGGATRDSAAIAGLPLPVLCKGTSPLRSKDRLVTARTDCPVSVDGVRICPGDIICLDDDGLVAVPAEHEREVLEQALAHLEWEAARDRDLHSRVSPTVNPAQQTPRPNS